VKPVVRCFLALFTGFMLAQVCLWAIILIGAEPKSYAQPDDVVAFVRRVPTFCWWWTGIVGYLAWCWLYIGPSWTRAFYRDPVWSIWWYTHTDDYGNTKLLDKETQIGFFPLPVVWLSTPFWYPFLLLWSCLCWVYPPFDFLIYGREK